MSDPNDTLMIESLLFIALYKEDYSLTDREKAGEEILALFKKVEAERDDAIQNKIQININPK